MLSAGETAPDFTAPTESGVPLTLSSLRGRPVILYFYPKANSIGCTVETRAFADHYAEFERAGFAVVGVSVDSVSTQKGFADRCEVRFPLVADSTKEIARRYGVLGFLGFARRVTFFISPGGTVEEVVEAIGPGTHVRRARERLADSGGTSKAGPASSSPPPRP